MAAVAGVNVCLRRVEAPAIFEAIRRHRVTQMSGAPIVYATLIDAPEKLRAGISHRITGTTGGSPPPSTTFSGAAAIGIDLIHIYGLTETYGPASVCQSRRAGRSCRAGARNKNRTTGHRNAAAGIDARARRHHDAGSAARRRNHRRDHVPRQHRDERLSEKRGCHASKFRRRLVPHRRPGPWSNRTATCASPTARKTSSSRAARTSPLSKSRMSCTGTLPSRPQPSSASPIQSGAKRHAPSLNCGKACLSKRQPSSISAGFILPNTRCQSGSYSPPFRGRQQAKCRNTSCAP